MPLAAHVLLLVCFGASYSFGSLFASLSGSFGTGSFPTATVFSLTAAVYYVVGAFSGQVADLVGVGPVTTTGVILVAAGFAVASGLTGSLPAFAAAFCPLVGCGVGLAYVPAIAAVQRRSETGRSRASGVAMAGTGVGTFVGPLLAAILLTWASLPATMLSLAAIVLVAGIPAAVSLGRLARPAGTPGRAVGGTNLGATLAEAVRTPRFWCLGGAILTGSVGQFAVLVHMAPYAATLGIPPVWAGLLVGMVGVGSVAGRLGLGWLADRAGHLRTLLALSAALFALQGLLPAAAGFVPLAAFSLLFGAANGGCIALFPALATDWFGTRRIGTILGALYASLALSALAGGSVAGYLRDLTGGYGAAVGVGAASALCSFLLLALAGRATPHGRPMPVRGPSSPGSPSIPDRRPSRRVPDDSRRPPPWAPSRFPGRCPG